MDILDEIWGDDISRPSKLIAEQRGVKYIVLKDDTPIIFLYKKVVRNKKVKGTLYLVDSKRCMKSSDRYIVIAKDRSLHPSNYSKIKVEGVDPDIIKKIEKVDL